MPIPPHGSHLLRLMGYYTFSRFPGPFQRWTLSQAEKCASLRSASFCKLSLVEFVHCGQEYLRQVPPGGANVSFAHSAGGQSIMGSSLISRLWTNCQRDGPDGKKQFRLFTTNLLSLPPDPNLATINDRRLKFIFLPILVYRLHLLQMPIRVISDLLLTQYQRHCHCWANLSFPWLWLSLPIISINHLMKENLEKIQFIFWLTPSRLLNLH